jgi:hypothetical protein
VAVIEIRNNVGFTASWNRLMGSHAYWTKHGSWSIRRLWGALFYRFGRNSAQWSATRVCLAYFITIRGKARQFGVENAPELSFLKERSVTGARIFMTRNQDMKALQAFGGIQSLLGDSEGSPELLVISLGADDTATDTGPD